MAARFADRADVLENTLRIADEVDVQFGKKYHVPSFPLPPGIATRTTCSFSSPTRARTRGTAKSSRPRSSSD